MDIMFPHFPHCSFSLDLRLSHSLCFGLLLAPTRSLLFNGPFNKHLLSIYYTALHLEDINICSKYIEINLAKYISKLLTLTHLWMGFIALPIFLYSSYFLQRKRINFIIKYYSNNTIIIMRD